VYPVLLYETHAKYAANVQSDRGMTRGQFHRKLIS
jgi:hypothetical protein